MALPNTVKVLDHCHVSPPLNSVPTTSLPLTFFDIPMSLSCPVQRIFFYEYSHSTLHFMNIILPSLKHSLSLTLQHFFPLAGTFTFPPHPSKPHILYTDGDSISLTIAESTIDFTHLVSNYPREAREFHSLVPQLSSACVSSDTHVVESIPVLALQVTIFPNFGICIGITYAHMVADGRTSDHFMKSWASIFRSKGDLSCIDDDKSKLPFYDRSVIKDSKGLDTIFLNELRTWRSSRKEDDTITIKNTTPFEDKFRATFVMGRCNIERLKQWILTVLQCKNGNESQPFHLSTFVVTCAFIWVCLIKSQDNAMNSNNNESFILDDDKLHHFAFPADCRNQYEFDDVPITYFGNCLAVRVASAKRGDLVRENGVVVAVKAIGSKVKELENGALKGAENLMSDLKELMESGEPILTVAGSPKLGLYETDFGWGRPKKIEVAHIDVSGSISLAECRDEKGGIEVGLALSKVEMEAFISIFEREAAVKGFVCVGLNWKYSAPNELSQHHK